MEEERGSEIVQMIGALWNEQKNRELLYLEALKKDSMSPFRRLLSQGHVSAVLFQKEIRSIYDYFKCFLTDRELGEVNQISSKLSLHNLQNLNEKEEVAGCLKKIEAATLQLYQTLRIYLEKDSETLGILDEHLVRISEFYESLCKLERGNKKSISYTVAA
ncbi:hypothetical protein [Dyadobacter pollutisoli]|jgi:hypothetical protein|uniref:Uncharacterized protein n=1 Tax=Dyadobacter pollutisoli TaxID=2910158 RepID=A0A9E8SM45_9BACT|nr:hypothetical protein [Dyadobacter pollutisoli]WAC09392.1 hypothetical protein ON006_16700 [Dyadobacter pollutisoli]